MAALYSPAGILKRLTFGIKKKKASKKVAVLPKEKAAQLLLRVLPGDDDAMESREVPLHASSSGSLAADREINLGLGLKLRTKNKKASLKTPRLDAQKEKVKKIRKLNRIYTWGDNIPDPLINFCDIANVPSSLLESFNEFGIKEPTPIQMQIIPLMIKQRELLASAPTGSGKTLAFAIPIILKVVRLKRLPKYEQKPEVIALVLEPTRELANQVYIQFVKFSQNLPVKCALMGGDEIPKDVDVIVSTPNRVAVIVESRPEIIYFDKLRWLIVDESDRLFDTTEGGERCFRSQLAKVYRACSHSKFVQHAFFSATFSYEVEEWCKENLHNVAMVCVGPRNAATDSVTQELVFTSNEQGKVIALRSLFQQEFEPPVLVFVQKKDRARQLLSEIEKFEPPISAVLISSEKSEKERTAALTSFREGKAWVLVCTELLGRGLDLMGVNLVVNFDLPTSIVSYIHRIGRAGRAGRRGRAITYFTESDLNLIRPIATVISQAGFSVPEYTLQMRKVSRSAKRRLLRHPPKRRNIGIVKRRRKKVPLNGQTPEQLNEASSDVPGRKTQIGRKRRMPKSRNFDKRRKS